MKEIELTIQTRAFPSEGRARVHESVLLMLEVKEEEAIEIMKLPLNMDEKQKQITLNVYADTMVDKGVIRLSPEDIAELAAADGDTVHVQRKIPLTEMISKKLNKTGEAIVEGAEELGESIEKA